jgi:hypothetical protein
MYLHIFTHRPMYNAHVHKCRYALQARLTCAHECNMHMYKCTHRYTHSYPHSRHIQTHTHLPAHSHMYTQSHPCACPHSVPTYTHGTTCIMHTHTSAQITRSRVQVHTHEHRCTCAHTLPLHTVWQIYHPSVGLGATEGPDGRCHHWVGWCR